MAIKKVYKHKRANELAVITNTKNGKFKYVYGDDWSLKDWEKIESFYKKHDYFRIDFE